jgi:hypothetical protein
MEKADGTPRPSYTKSHLPGHSPLAAVLEQRSSLRPHLLKLRQMGTERVQMKGALPWLVYWALHASTRGFCLASAALLGTVQNMYYVLLPYIIYVMESGRFSQSPD